MEPKTIEQIRTEKSQMEFAIREVIKAFLKSNPGLLPSIEISYTTQQDFTRKDAFKLLSINVKASITI